MTEAMTGLYALVGAYVSVIKIIINQSSSY